MLRRIGEALAGIQSLTVAECERAFNCKLSLKDKRPRPKYWGTCPELSIELLEMRFWRTGGIVDAYLDKRVQEGLMEELQTLGKRIDSEFPSPGFTPTPSSDEIWSYAYDIAGAKIWYRMARIDGIEYLESVFRTFESI